MSIISDSPPLTSREQWLISQIAEHSRKLDALLGKPIPGHWTPIGQMRDPNTADDPVLARKLMKKMLQRAKRESGKLPFFWNEEPGDGLLDTDTVQMA